MYRNLFRLRGLGDIAIGVKQKPSQLEQVAIRQIPYAIESQIVITKGVAYDAASYKDGSQNHGEQ